MRNSNATDTAVSAPRTLQMSQAKPHKLAHFRRRTFFHDFFAVNHDSAGKAPDEATRTTKIARFGGKKRWIGLEQSSKRSNIYLGTHGNSPTPHIEGI